MKVDQGDLNAAKDILQPLTTQKDTQSANLQPFASFAYCWQRMSMKKGYN
jgi:hypothetical protein